MKHFTVTFKPDNEIIHIHAGATLLEAAGQAGITLNSACGGSGTCKKCKVLIGDERKEVLACQYHIDSDLQVFIPKESLFYEQKILAEGSSRSFHIESCYEKFVVQNTDSGKNLTVLQEKIESASYKISSNAMEQLASFSEENIVTAVARLESCQCDNAWTVVSFESGDTSDILLGVAVDIGTTTMVAKLMDLRTGNVLATESCLNPQIKWGDDVVSRIKHAETEDGLAQLHNAMIEKLNTLIDGVCEKHKISPQQILELTAVGNTTMNHLFLKFPVKQLGQAPYHPHSVEAHDLVPEELGIQIHPQGRIHAMANIAGFVGADTTSVALATELEEMQQLTLIIDVGTNGELLLGARGEFYAASCAAGPAFEGARIRQGSRAADGAIETVVINDTDIDVDVIGNAAPVSICGSGLIDAVAVMLELGVIDKTGRIIEPENVLEKFKDNLKRRMIEIDGEFAFVLAFDDSGKPAVSLTQKDIRQTQLAKAAIRAGIILLLKEMNVTESDLEQVLLAGAFGNYVRKVSARRAGLLPNVPLSKIRNVGNAACVGAQMALLSCTQRCKASALAKKIKYVEIAHRPDFSDVFMDAILF